MPPNSAWSHSRLDRNLRRNLGNIPEPRDVPSETQEANTQHGRSRPTERRASSAAESHCRTNRPSGLKNIPKPESVSRKAQDTDEPHGSGRASRRETSPSTIAPSVIANVEPNLLSSAPRPHPAYRTLRKGHIRLLRIVPADSTTQICCQMDQFSLRRPPVYTALSYTWGSQHGIHEIYINGRPLLVPKNLFRFLNCARDLGGDLSGWIWCDMLSINQVDLVERGYQVTLMSKIFHTAQTVVVWLGPAHRGSDLAMTAIARLPRGEEFAKQASRLWVSDAGHAMDDLCRRNYWRRLWIFQEVRLARRMRLMCGSKTASWKSFQALMQFADTRSGIAQLDDSTEIVASSPAMRMVRLNLKSVDTALWSLVQETKHLRCFDARDKIYALLGVATEGHENFKPDYTIGTPTLLNALLHDIWTHLPPNTFLEALEMCNKVEDAFGVERGTVFVIKGQRGLYNTPSDTAMRGCRLGPSFSDFNLWWTAFYGHSHLQTLHLECWHLDYFKGDKSIPVDDISPDVVALFRFLRKDMDTRHTFLAPEYPPSDSDIESDHVTDEEGEFAYLEKFEALDRDRDGAKSFDSKARIGDLSLYWVSFYITAALETNELRIFSLMVDLIMNLIPTKGERQALANLVKNDYGFTPKKWRGGGVLVPKYYER